MEPFQFLIQFLLLDTQRDSGVINGYLAKVNLQDGKLKWEKSFESMSKNKSTAFESILITSDQGLILSG